MARVNRELLGNRKERLSKLVGSLEFPEEVTVADRRTGYYVAGRDWPAIRSDISLADIYKALDGIDDDAVEAAMDTLRTVEVPPEDSGEHQAVA